MLLILRCTLANYDKATDIATFYIKALGPNTFTRKLYELISSSSAEEISNPLSICVYGPLGSMTIDLKQYNHILLIAGGIGITPMILILKNIIHGYSNLGQYSNLSQIKLIWTMRNNDPQFILEETLLELFQNHIETNDGNDCNNHNHDDNYDDNNRTWNTRPLEIIFEYYVTSGYKSYYMNDDKAYDNQKTMNNIKFSVLKYDHRPNIHDSIIKMKQNSSQLDNLSSISVENR